MHSLHGKMIRAGIVAVAMAAAVTAAHARPDTRAMTCEQTQRLIERNGAVVLTTGQHTYDRYVGGRGFCERPYAPMQTTVRTRDTANCPVYNCQRYEPIFDFYR